MTHLVKMGNSQGIRIPKQLIKRAQLENKELTLRVVDNGLLITTDKTVRANWKTQCEAIITAQGHEVLDQDWLNASLTSDDELDWECTK